MPQPSRPQRVRGADVTPGEAPAFRVWTFISNPYFLQRKRSRQQTNSDVCSYASPRRWTPVRVSDRIRRPERESCDISCCVTSDVGARARRAVQWVLRSLAAALAPSGVSRTRSGTSREQSRDNRANSPPSRWVKARDRSPGARADGPGPQVPCRRAEDFAADPTGVRSPGGTPRLTADHGRHPFTSRCAGPPGVL